MRTYAAQECQVNSRSVCEVRHEALIRAAALFPKERGDDRGFTGVGRRGGGPRGRQASDAADEQHRSEYSAHPQEGVKPAHSSLEVQGGTPVFGAPTIPQVLFPELLSFSTDRYDARC